MSEVKNDRDQRKLWQCIRPNLEKKKENLVVLDADLASSYQDR